jgi:hypothetical protein
VIAAIVVLLYLTFTSAVTLVPLPVLYEWMAGRGGEQHA